MSVMSSLVPARFLALAAHLVIVVTIFWSRENNVRASLPLDFTEEQHRTEDTRLVIGLSVTVCLFLVELVGFFSGVSMFNSNQSLLCILTACTHKTISSSDKNTCFFTECVVISIQSCGISLQCIGQSLLLRFPAVGVLDLLARVRPLQVSAAPITLG
ncbi:hypothetical protein P4O66_006939 [Electrophorus voltai]|uniref:Transmembrane protein 107 n=1 Tax=Electrophorus voltai TaxID=2609070 RepID=A0AAD8ZJF9_9TELE|nr:hypothetical protein P4O66_006939 [Electrophorus voltai]